MHISVVLGTAREGRQSEKVAKYVYERLNSQDIGHSYVDVRDHLQTFATTRYGIEEEKDSTWREIACKSEAFIFVLPEYNHGYPGEWKLLMDTLYKKEYQDKVAGLVGVSSGVFGGVRGLELATLTLATRGVHVLKDTLQFPKVQSYFDESGVLTDEVQKERVETFLQNVVEYTKRHIS